MNAPQAVRPVLELNPCGHARHCREPGAAANDLGQQRTQRYPPGCDLAKPGRHRRSVVCPPSVTISTPAFGTAPCRHGDG